MRLLSVKEAANILSLSPRTLYGWHWKGKAFPFIKLGRSLRVDEDGLARFIQTHRSKTGRKGIM